MENTIEEHKYKQGDLEKGLVEAQNEILLLKEMLMDLKKQVMCK